MKSEEEEDAGYSSFQEVKVVLKVLGSGHRDISLVRHNQISCTSCSNEDYTPPVTSNYTETH